MSDIVQRLRNREGLVIEGPRRLVMHCEEAADEIVNLRAELVAVKDAANTDAMLLQQTRNELAECERALKAMQEALKSIENIWNDSTGKKTWRMTTIACAALHPQGEEK